jgi:hypothetical protein
LSSLRRDCRGVQETGNLKNPWISIKPLRKYN